MNTEILNYGTSKILWYILHFCLYFNIECFNPDISNIPRNYSKEDMGPLFDTNQIWNRGDIPVLNRKVFRGLRVTIREHPYVASVRRNLMHYCVATVIHKNIFLTVAHPVSDVPIDELSIVTGENYADRGSLMLDVIVVVIHEDFDLYTLANDIALLRVHENITPFRCAVKPIGLVHPFAPFASRTAFVTGWGRCDRSGNELCLPRSGKYTPGEWFDPMLRSISFTIKDNNPYCNNYKENGVNFWPGMLCLGLARQEDRVAPCLAVPGAPLVLSGQLAGVLSWGYGCGYMNDLPLVYSSMQYFQPWLVHNIPLLRNLSKEDLTPLFEAKRAYVLTKYLNLTRLYQPGPFNQTDKVLEMLQLDKTLSLTKGYVIDIRDFLYDGLYHQQKIELYARERRNNYEKQYVSQIKKDISTDKPKPFLDVNSNMEVISSLNVNPESTENEEDNLPNEKDLKNDYDDEQI